MDWKERLAKIVARKIAKNAIVGKVLKRAWLYRDERSNSRRLIAVSQARACENAMDFLYVGDHMKEKYMSWRIAMTRKESDAYIKQKAPTRDDLMYRPGEKKRRGRYAPLRSYAKQTREAPSAVVTGSL